MWVGKWDLIHWDWDFCTGNGTQNIKWEWEFCFNPMSKKYFLKYKQKSNNSVMECYPIKKIGKLVFIKNITQTAVINILKTFIL